MTEHIEVEVKVDSTIKRDFAAKSGLRKCPILPGYLVRMARKSLKSGNLEFRA